MAKKVRPAKANATGRNSTSRFVLLPHWLLKCSAWLTLSSHAKALLIDVWRRHNGANNGAIAYAVRDAEDIGLSKDQAGRAFSELVERGFLKLRRASTFSLKTKEARTWELTGEPCGDQSATKDFMKWVPETVAPLSTKIRTRSHQRDTRSHQRDREPKMETKLPIIVSPARPSEPKPAGLRSHQCDTYIYHGGSGEAGAASATLPASPPPKASPAAVGRPRRNGIVPDALTGQTDLESFIALSGGCVGSGEAPRNVLREDLMTFLNRSPRGTTAALASRIGLSRPQLVNFKVGRYELNATAANMLRKILDEEARP